MITGHEETLRQETPDGWVYVDPQNGALQAALQPYGIRLELLDDFIEKMEAEGSAPPDQLVYLRDRRRFALWAFNNNRKFQELGLEAWRSYIEVIVCQMRIFELTGELLPFAKYKEEQSEKAKKPRSPILENGKSLTDVIKSIVRANPEERAKDLWTRLYGELDRIGAKPQIVNHRNNKGTHKKDHVNYMNDEGTDKKLTFGTFEGYVGELRKVSDKPG